MTDLPPANWYPDPHDASQLRYWDGAQWTEHRHPVTPAVAQSTAAAGTSSVDQTAAGPAGAADVADVGDAVLEAAAARSGGVLSAPSRQPASWSPRTAAPEPPRPERKNRALLIAGVVGVLALLAAVFAFTRNGEDDSATAPSPSQAAGSTVRSATTAPGASAIPPTTGARPATTAAPATTAGTPLTGTAYADPAGQYRLLLAPTWEPAGSTTPNIVSWFTRAATTTFRDNANVLVEKLPSDVSMSTYLAASVSNAPKTLQSFVEVNRSTQNINGKTVGQLDFTSTQQGLQLRHRAIVVIKNRNAVVLTYTSEASRFDVEVGAVQPYLLTLEAL